MWDSNVARLYEERVGRRSEKKEDSRKMWLCNVATSY
jgi:hypothetical protein